ncbi:MAG: hypothetical protein DA328_07185 [Nitrososphaeraceae archaeon]|nr:hypothetical protein [Nitrososphaeraceae archaeon]
MSYPIIEIICGKCGSSVNKMINIKPIKEIVRQSNGKCRNCGTLLNPNEFSVNFGEKSFSS